MVGEGALAPTEELGVLPIGWRWARLKELIDQDRGICYGIVQPGKHDPGGVPMVNSQDVVGGKVSPRIEFRVSPELHKRYRRSTIRGGEILLTLVGANFGQVAIAPPYLAGSNCSRAVGILPVTESPEFVAFCLRSPFVRRYMDNWANTTAQPTFNLKDVANLPVPWPTTWERGAIAQILSALDNKIDLNRRMNDTLDSMALALFKSWFVDFDPVRAKAEGRDHGLPKQLANLFPDFFEGSDLGEIPKGWRVGSVDDDFDLTMGQSPPGETYNEAGVGLPFYQGCTDFGFRFPTRRIYCTAPTRLGKAGDTLVSVRAPVGDINMATEDCAIGRGVAAVRHKTGSRSYSYQFMQSIEEVFARFEAEGTVFGAIGKKDFHAIACVNPPRELVLAYEARVSSFDDRVEVNERESRTLTALRDALLPKLIAGELRVTEAEQIVENA